MPSGGAGLRCSLMARNDDLCKGAVRARPARTPAHGDGFGERLGFRGGVRLYVDLEGWPTDTDWFRGWCSDMAPSPYLGLGGVYGNAVSAWSWPRQGTAGAEAEFDQQFTSVLDDLIAGRTVSKALNLHFGPQDPAYPKITRCPQDSKSCLGGSPRSDPRRTW